MAGLRLRAGVLTGNAAVDLGAEGEGMVLGDSVNTASRLQSIAAPGTVLVDDATRRAAEAAIAYEDAGTHQVKGREQPVHAWTALRVVAGAGGARRGVGLEAPFVGRERELQTIIDAGEVERARRPRAARGGPRRGRIRQIAAALGVLQVPRRDRGDAVLASGPLPLLRRGGRVLGAGGDGPLAGGDPGGGGSRLRAGEAEGCRSSSTWTMSVSAVSSSRGSRTCCGWSERPDADRVDLFSGWRLFFERMAQTNPVILAFEDLQWADSGLLEFIDYLLEWSAEFPIFVITLGRPELRERRPGVAAARARAARARGDRRAARRPRARAARGARQRDRPPRPRGSRCTPSRPCGCCMTAACSCRRGRATSSPATCPTSMCPRRCMRWSPRGSTVCRPRSARCCRTRRCSGSRSRRRRVAALSGMPEAEVARVLEGAGRQAGALA